LWTTHYIQAQNHSAIVVTARIKRAFPAALDTAIRD
jgi:hypothetical protein